MVVSFSIIYIGARALESYLLGIVAPSPTVIPLLHKATFTPSIQPNLAIHLHTYVINIRLAILYSAVLYKCPNHLNTL